jgi:hypothetical protein
MGKQRLTKGAALVGGIDSLPGGSVTAGSPGFAVGVASMAFKMARVRLSLATTGLRTYALSLNPGDVVLDAYLDVGTQEATASAKTANLGVTGTTAGFLAAASTASVGPVVGSLVAGSVTKGSLLSEGTAASGRFSKPYVVTATSVALTSQCSETHTEAVVDACVVYLSIA